MSDPTNPLVGKRQTFWDWRAAMNWCCGGLAGGSIFAVWAASWLHLVEHAALNRLFVLFAAIMAVGLVCVFLKIGRPLRFWRAFTMGRSSWMSRELYVVIVFFAALLAHLVHPHPLLASIVGFAAIAFVYCQAQILHAAKGIPAWRAQLVPTLILGSALLEGAGMLALLGGLMPASVHSSNVVAGAILLLALVNGALFHHYRAHARADGIPPLARREIDAMAVLLHALGHGMPALLAFVSLVAPIDPGVMLPFAGAGAVFAGFWWKFALVTRASYQQGFALPMAPQRGSGKRAAPARLQGLAA